MFKVVMVTEDAFGANTGYTVKVRYWDDVECLMEDAQIDADDFEDAEKYQTRIDQGFIAKGKATVIDSNGKKYKTEPPNFVAERVVGYMVFEGDEVIESHGFRTANSIRFTEKYYDVCLFDWC